jgi:tetratricopeptide (TPR) repeat protein
LFALETLKLAWHDGSITLADGLPRPSSLTQLIGQQLARLSSAALQLARVAAVAGVDFDIPLAQSLLQRSALELADAWAELEAQHVLRGAAFAHDLIHDAVLQGLPEVIARHLHGACAAWLEGSQAEPARVAAHWEAAGQRARALPALRAAAERAHRALREEERIQLLLHAAEIAEAAERLDEAFELVHQAIGGHMSTIRQADGLPLLAHLARLARTPLQQARVAGNRAWYAAVLGDLPTALACGEQALQMALPLGDEAADRHACTSAWARRWRWPPASARRCRTCMPPKAGWRRGPARRSAASSSAIWPSCSTPGPPAEAQRHHLRAIADAAAQGDLASRATLLANHANSRLDAGDLSPPPEQAAQAQRIVVEFELAGSSAGYIATCARSAPAPRASYADGPAELRTGRIAAGRAQPGACAGGPPAPGPGLAGPGPARARPAGAGRRSAGNRTCPARPLCGALAGAAGPCQAAARTAPGPGRCCLAGRSRCAGTQRRLARTGASSWAPSRRWTWTRKAAIEALGRVAQQARQAAAARCGVGCAAAAGSAGGDRRSRRCPPSRPGRAGSGADHRGPAHRPRLALAGTGHGAGRTGASAGRSGPGRSWAQAGQQWLRTTAAVQMAPEFADSFLHQHPVNQALLAWRACHATGRPA